MTDFYKLLEFATNDNGAIIETPLTIYYDKETDTTVAAFESDNVDFRFTFNDQGDLVETGFYS